MKKVADVRAVVWDVVKEFCKNMHGHSGVTSEDLRLNLVKDLGFDSLDVVELTMDLEDRFDTDIPDASSQQFETVGDIVDYLQNKKDEKPCPR